MEKKTVVIYGGSEDIKNSELKEFVKLDLEDFLETNKEKIGLILFGGQNSGVMGTMFSAANKVGIIIKGYSTEEYRKYDQGNGVDLTFFATEKERQQAFIEEGDHFIGLPGGNGTTHEILSTQSAIAEQAMNKKISVSHGFRAFRLYHNALEEDGMIAKRDRGIIEIVKNLSEIKL